MTGLPSREHLDTERADPAAAELDRLPTADALELFLAADREVPARVADAREAIAAAVDLVAARLARGGRLFYVGAGTSGRLGVLDASECPPTFGCVPALVQGVIAGGEQALTGAVEGAEDDAVAGGDELEARDVGPDDAVVGITAGGTTPFVHGALARARAAGAATVFLACVPRDQAPDEADVSIRVLTGPELLAGSTRLKAGTATKMVLNAISTLVMARLGHVHGNLMVGLDAGANEKLGRRGVSILEALTGLSRPEAAALFESAGGEVKVAALMAARRVDAAGARARLREVDGSLRRALSD